MKIQTSAIVDILKINGESIPLDEDQKIALEFSAIDTGGGFKDPMLDFSIPYSGGEATNHKKSKVSLSLQNPQNAEQVIQLSYEGEITVAEREVNGRLTQEELTKEVVNFVFKLLR